MPRTGRLLIPGGCYHIYGRGFERRQIFLEPECKHDFLKRLEKSLKKQNVHCLAWALMSNHYHALIRVGNSQLDKLMSPVLTGFAGFFNRRHNRSGYVFQNRYESILCDEQSYFLELARYIHLNPVRSGQITTLEELDSYPWTGHSAVMGNVANKLLSIDELLSHFGKSLGSARRKYRKFLNDGVDNPPAIGLTGGGLIRSYQGWESVIKIRREHKICIGDERILGTADFVESALKKDKLSISKHTLHKRQGWNFDNLRLAVCKRFKIPVEKLATKSRAAGPSEAKSLLCYWAVEELGVSVIEVADQLKMSHQGVSKRVEAGREVSVRRRVYFDDLELSS